MSTSAALTTTTTCTTLTTTTTTATSSASLDWSWLEELEFGEIAHLNIDSCGSAYASKVLNELSCPLFKSGGTWECRLAFVKKVIEDVVDSCRKDEELSILFLGPRTLLVECLIVRGLLKNGYRHMTLFLIDPVYYYCIEEKKRDRLFIDFGEQIGKAYAEQWQAPLPQGVIYMVTRAPLIGACFSKNHPQVLLVESVPPYGGPFTAMEKLKIPVPKKPEESFAGGHIVPREDANALIFMPRRLYYRLGAEGVSFNHTVPFVAFDYENSMYYFDCGVKIGQDGSIFVSMTGMEEYSKGKLNKESFLDKIKLMVDSEIAKIRPDNHPQRNLTQEEITSVLIFVKERLRDIMGMDLKFFFTADYALDRAELITYLSNRTSQHYRKNIIIEAHLSETPKITINTL